jgi:hypothetical protein
MTLLTPVLGSYQHSFHNANKTIHQTLSSTNSLLGNATIAISEVKSTIKNNGTTHHCPELKRHLARQSRSVLSQYTPVNCHLVELEDALFSMAILFYEEVDLIRQAKHRHFSYWKWILASHRDRMYQLTKRHVHYAQLLGFTINAARTTASAKSSMAEIGEEIKVFEQECSNGY